MISYLLLLNELFEIFRKINLIITMYIYQYSFRLDKTTWQNRLDEMSWRDGFTEQMFTRFQHILDFVCTRLHNKKAVKKNINIDEVCFHSFVKHFVFVFFLGISYSSIFSQFIDYNLTTYSTNVFSKITTNSC